MCICFAADREGRVVACRVNQTTPTSRSIQEAFGTRIGESGAFLCGGATAYYKLSEAENCQKIVLNTHKDYNKATI